jgi:GDP-D-mannose dehydratase
MKVALMTGIAGQNGSYLVELLLEKGNENSWLESKDWNSSGNLSYL